MGIFSLDIEKFYEEQFDLGQQVLGIFVLQYPIYCIHANIHDQTPDPLDNLDKIIVDLLRTKADISALQIASLIGTSKTLVGMRLATLESDGLIFSADSGTELTEEGVDVFIKGDQTRQHKRSYDFYLDGTNFRPLPVTFYKHYRNKFISENDVVIKTLDNGKEIVQKPFGPDIVHTPPNKEAIIEKIMSVDIMNRVEMGIPSGLDNIDDLTYTKLSFQLLVSVTSKEGKLTKELLDPFAVFSFSDDLTYFETLKHNVRIFEHKLIDRIANLEFRLVLPRRSTGDSREALPILGSNWAEIDRFKESANKCFMFANDDLSSYLKGIFDINLSSSESLVNTERELKISINKAMLIESPNKSKLISDLARKRDYRFGFPDSTVFLLYIYYDTKDPYVLEILRFRDLVVDAKKKGLISLEWVSVIQKDFEIGYRELFVSSGELELLELLAMEKFMAQLN